MIQTIGKRISQHRNELGWTQQYLADRLAISRVAVSHIEMDISTPGERTITLLAGLFKTTPHALVEDTTYPSAKADRLPLVVCSYTTLELDLELLKNDLVWLGKLRNTRGYRQIRSEIFEKWEKKLDDLNYRTIDQNEQHLLKKAHQIFFNFKEN